jgi:hypothetical protein
MILTSPAFSQQVENLLMDGDFEDPVSGWGLATRPPAAATFTIDTEVKRVGQASARIDITNVGDGTSNHNLTLDNDAGIAVEANKTYTVDFWTKAETDRTLIIDSLLNQSPWTRLFRATDLPVTTEWTRIHQTFQADATMSPVVFLFSFVDSTTTIWLDHVRFYEGEFDEEGGSPELAYNPDPKDAATVEATWANLSWTPGSFAVTHDLYFGTSFDDVNESAEQTFVGSLPTTNQVVGFTGFPAPDGLVPGTTYYWRVDEVNETEPNSPWVGDVWSFSIAPYTAYNPDPADGAEFVDLDATLTWTGGYGAKLHYVYLGTNFDEINDATGGAPVGAATYSPPGSLEAEMVYYWRVDEFDAFETHKGDIWAFTTPGAVGNPRPANGDADVQILTNLAWTPADNAASSDLYFGSNAEAVKNATAASPEYAGNKALGSESHDPGKLALGTDYHWRVDAVYPDQTVKGLLWSFATADFIVVDDFESYDDVDPLPGEPGINRIFDKWVDGFGIPTNGALVGNDMPPYAERTIVHGGAQSMICRYDNAGKTSEATLTLVYPRDWTEQGVTKLSLWLNGSAANAPDRIYVALNNTAVIYHDDASATQIAGWNEWAIDLSAFGGLGVDLTTVNTITIGIGTRNAQAPDGGTGTLYIDDIRLYR